MTQQEVFDSLKEIISLIKPKLDLSGVTKDSDLLKDLGIDSLSMLMLSLAIEDKFGIRFESPEPFQRVNQVIDYILAQKS